MSGPRKTLRRITDQILGSEDFGALRAACVELHELFSRLNGVGEDSPDELDAVQSRLDCGRAISPRDAARCVVDFARTVAFLRGIDAALADLQMGFPGTRLEVLYAGCGPFAPLLLPLLDRYSPDELRVTLLDIHQRSLDAAAVAVRELGFEPFIRAFTVADASTYEHPTRPHLIICEMLQQGLLGEPQVEVTGQLAPQLIEGGIFMPERITVDGCLADLRCEMGLEGTKPDRILLGRLIELAAESIRAGHRTSLSPVTVQVPAVDVNRYQLFLLTRVQVFGSIMLGDRDSAITYPLPLSRLRTLAPGDRIEFTYVTGPNPHFEYRLTPAPDPRLPAPA